MAQEIKMFGYTDPEMRNNTRSNASGALVEYSEEFNAALEKLSIEPNPEIKGIELELVQRYIKRNKQYGIETKNAPKVYYVPYKHNKSVSALMHDKTERWGGFLPVINAVYVLAGEGIPRLETARSLEHELDHAFSKVSLRVTHNSSEERGDFSFYRNGCIMESPGGSFGRVFEEGEVTSHEVRYAQSELKLKFPADHENYLHMLQKAIFQCYLIGEDQAGYAKVHHVNTERDTAQIGPSQYVWAAKLVDFIRGELPDGAELITRSRVTGHLADLTGAFEARFGKGSFRVFMTCGFSKEECDAMKAYLVETEPIRKEEMAKEILAARPYDMERHERRIAVSKKIQAGEHNKSEGEN